MKKLAVGGTFDCLHAGHRQLLHTAFAYGERVVIGLTSDRMASGKGASSYRERLAELERFLEQEGYSGRAEIVELNDPYGTAVSDPELDGIVVTEETLERAREINRIRERRGLGKLEILVVPMVLAEDGMPVSSERIRKGMIDREGRVCASRWAH
ncbi:MAG: pantetheine-phosphate adenylyltransferase [Euryarchaeota archaeon]|nr:pantetheine-phosphate adenylyltransferase [Euryarchaeota archaeon]